MPRPIVEGRRSQRERSEATMGELVAAARNLFATLGYAGTSLEEVASVAGVTKGALYHHFAGKRELFRAVVAEEQRRLDARLAEAYRRKTDPWEAFSAACRAFLEEATDPAVARIVVLDAPSVLGWETIREMEANAFASTVAAVKRAIDAGRLPPQSPEALGHLLYGAVCEGAMVIARADNQRRALREVLQAFRALLDGLLIESERERTLRS